jgi:microcystin degradation protein MlrC
MKRVLIGGMQHETNMFNPALTGLEAFRIRGLFFGDEIVAKRRGTNTEAGGFIDSLEKHGIEIVPSALGEANRQGNHDNPPEEQDLLHNFGMRGTRKVF